MAGVNHAVAAGKPETFREAYGEEILLDYDAIKEQVVLYAYWNPRFHGIHTVELHRTQNGYIVTNLGYLRGRYFSSMGDALRAIRTPMAILCLGISLKQP